LRARCTSTCEQWVAVVSARWLWWEGSRQSGETHGDDQRSLVYSVLGIWRARADGTAPRRAIRPSHRVPVRQTQTAGSTSTKFRRRRQFSQPRSALCSPGPERTFHETHSLWTRPPKLRYHPPNPYCHVIRRRVIVVVLRVFLSCPNNTFLFSLENSNVIIIINLRRPKLSPLITFYSWIRFSW